MLLHYVVQDIGMPIAGAIGYTPLACLLSLSLFHVTKYDSSCIRGDYGEGEQCKAGSRNIDLQCSMKESFPIQCFCDTGEKSNTSIDRDLGLKFLAGAASSLSIAGFAV